MDKQENSLCSPKIGILDLNSDDRPREKLEAMGPHALSKAELLAILIGSGNAEENAVQLMQRLMADCDGQLNNLSRLTIEELCHYKGIGRAKAITLVAAMALAEERQREQNDVVKIQQAEDIYKYYRPRLGALTHEESHVLLLNQRLRVIGSKLVSRGGLTGTVVDVRMVLKAALLANATHIALCHNHPSGNPKPSRDDDELTKKLANAARAVDIRLIDHVVVALNGFYSYQDEGKL